MRNVAYTWRNSKKIREISLTGQKIHANETIWSMKIVTRKNTRGEYPEDWKSSLKVGRTRISFSSSDFSRLHILARYPFLTIARSDISLYSPDIRKSQELFVQQCNFFRFTPNTLIREKYLSERTSHKKELRFVSTFDH